jgi:GNAT superfamily N-acetyltransferase
MGIRRKKINPAFNECSNSALKLSKFNGHSVHIVEANNQQSLNLFFKAYKDIYEPAFPIPEERESHEEFLKSLAGESHNARIAIAIIGENMDTKSPTLKGIVIGYYYHKEDVGLLAYTATSPEHRNQGLGRIQVDVFGQALLSLAKSNGGKLGGFFLECNDPEKVKPEEDSFDPATRIKIFQKWGARVMPVDYIQPPVAKGADNCPRLKLLAYPHPETGQYPTLNGIQAFIKGIYAACAQYYGCTPEQNPDYIKIMQQIASMRQDNTLPKQKPPSP